MSVGEHDGSTPEPTNQIPDLLSKLDDGKDSLRAKLQAYADNPSGATVQQSIDQSEALRDTLSEVVCEIASDGELAEDERASSIATVYYNIRDSRLELFRAKAPEGDYDADFPDREQIAENILDCFKAGMDAGEIAEDVKESYTSDFICDLDEFSEFLEPSRKMKAKLLAWQVGDQALAIGKISAGVVIGGLILQKISKKTGL